MKSAKILIRIAVILLLVNAATLGASAQTGAVEKVWIEYDVKLKGETGIRIHAKFSVAKALNIGCSIQGTIERLDGKSMLTNSSGSVYKVGDKVLVLKTFTPPYDPTTYPDTRLFVPYWALSLREANPNKMKVTIVLVGGGKQFAGTTMDFEKPLGKSR